MGSVNLEYCPKNGAFKGRKIEAKISSQKDSCSLPPKPKFTNFSPLKGAVDKETNEGEEPFETTKENIESHFAHEINTEKHQESNKIKISLGSSSEDGKEEEETSEIDLKFKISAKEDDCFQISQHLPQSNSAFD